MWGLFSHTEELVPAQSLGKAADSKKGSWLRCEHKVPHPPLQECPQATAP